MEKNIIYIEEILAKIKKFRDENYEKGSAGYIALHDLYCLLVSTYVYKGWWLLWLKMIINLRFIFIII